MNNLIFTDVCTYILIVPACVLVWVISRQHGDCFVAKTSFTVFRVVISRDHGVVFIGIVGCHFARVQEVSGTVWIRVVSGSVDTNRR